MNALNLLNEPYYLKGTQDRACLMLHGLGGGAYELWLLAQRLHRQGLTVQGVLYPGHDRPGAMPPSRWQDWFEHSAAQLALLQTQFAQVDLIGFSTGCPLALHLATQYPVGNLVLLAPFLALPFPLEALVQSLGRVIPQTPRLALPLKDRAMRREAEQVAFLRTMNMAAVRSALDLIAVVKSELATITNRTLLIQSPLDSVVAPRGAQVIYDNLASVEKRLIWLKTSDHIVPLDLEREAVFQTVEQFLGYGDSQIDEGINFN